MSATSPPADLHGNLKTPYTKLDPAGLALLVIDAQNDFAHPRGAFPLPGLDGVVPGWYGPSSCSRPPAVR